MSSSINRRKRKSAESTQRLVKKLASKMNLPEGVTVDPVVQGMKILAMEENLKKLVEVQQINYQNLLRAFHMSDAHLWVLRKISEDTARGALQLREAPVFEPVLGCESVIDMPHYYGLFNEQSVKMQSAQAAQTEAPDPEDNNVDVFGGDAEPPAPQVIHASA